MGTQAISSNMQPAPTAGKTGQSTPEDPKLRQACQDMETIFLHYMMQKMRESVPKDGLLEDSTAQDTYQDMLDVEFAKNASKQGSFGLGEMLYKQLSVSLKPAADSSAAGKQTEDGVTRK